LKIGTVIAPCQQVQSLAGILEITGSLNGTIG